MAIWISSRPVVGDRWADVDDIVIDNWETYGSATSAEHGSLGSTASGTHFGKAVGSCYYGSTTDIDALTAPPCGALAYDSTIGYLKRYWAGAWAPTTSAGRSRARWYLSANNAMGSVDGNTQTVGLSLTSKNFDTYSEYACATGKYVASADGYYMVNAQVTMASSGLRGISSASSATNDVQTGFSKPTITYRYVPCADGTTQQWSAGSPTQTAGNWHENIIYEVFTDSDYLRENTPGASGYFAVTRPTISTATPVLPSACIALYAKNTTIYQASQSAAIVFNDGSKSDWEDFDTTGTLTWLYSTALGTNPRTAAAWTAAELDGSDATNGISGIMLYKGNGYSVDIYQAVISATWSYANNYAYIQEYPTPTDTDYLSALVYAAGASNKTDTYSASGGWGTLPALATNISASVWIRAKAAAGNAISAGAVLRLNDGVAYSGDRLSPRVPMCAVSQVDFTTYQFPFPNNPSTNEAWTPGQINGTVGSQSLTGFGFYTSGTAAGGQEMDVSQSFLVVDWQNPDPTTTLDIYEDYGAVSTSAIVARGRLVQPQTGLMRNDTVRAMGITQLTAGGHLTCWVTKTLDDDTILSGTDKTFMAVHRLGGAPCL